jgi:hypothetical protein
MSLSAKPRNLLRDLTHDERVELARAIMNMLDDWKIGNDDRVVLLDLPPETKGRSMRRYSENTPFPDSGETYARIEHLLGIADALRTSFPRSAEAGAIWMQRRNGRFDNRSPLRVMLDEGMGGIVHIRTHLDCAYDWHISGSTVTPTG